MEDPRNYKDILVDIFPGRPRQHIEDIIQIVSENSPEQEFDNMLEEMINLLMESGDSTLQAGFEEYQEEAAGYGHANAGYGHYVSVLERLFPDICPSFIRKFCEEKCQHITENDLNDIVDDLFAGGYVIKGNRSDSIFEQLTDMIPDADPDYLREQSEILADKTAEDLEAFIEHAIEKNDFPNRRDYYKRQKTINELKMYTTDFSIESYLSVISDPFEHFSSTSYKSALTNDNATKEDEDYAMNSLLNCFPYLREKDIRKVFNKFNKNIIRTSDTLARVPRHFKTARQLKIQTGTCQNIQLLQEVAFVEHKQQLKTAMKMKNQLYRWARAEAEKYNLLETCQCCFYEGLLPEECFFCKKNCAFCKECVAKGAEHVIGKGELVFGCLSNCNSEFEIATLKMVLDKKVFEPLFAKIQIEEVKKANIDGLETCPFCDFSMILTNQEKIFKCQNIECMEESCRECRHKSHVPYRCNEIEYDEDVKKRTYIENKMTEALVRTCWKCKKSFLKESGCNKMTCPCGAKMCYICGAADISYEHFGEISKNRCPLYTQDLNKLHAQRVITSARRAKAELGVNNDPQLLKIDPTEGLEEYFGTL